MSEQICQTCRFFSAGANEDEEFGGCCHRYPRAAVFRSDGAQISYVFPNVYADDWCGEHVVRNAPGSLFADPYTGGLPSRVTNCLEAAELVTDGKVDVYRLIEMGIDGWRHAMPRNFGDKSSRQLRQWLELQVRRAEKN